MFRKLKNIRKHSIRFAASFIIAGILFSNPTIVSAAAIQDIDLSSDYAKDAIAALVEQNIITGDERGHFHPHKAVTRAEMITMIVNALHISTENIPEQPTFRDVPQTHWAYKYIEAAYREGIVQGMSKNIFGKNESCTREQMAVMFTNALGLPDQKIYSAQEFNYIHKLIDKDKISSWAKNAVEFSLASGFMRGTGNDLFEPKKSAQKQQVAILTHRLLYDREELLAFAEEQSQMERYPDLYEALNVKEPYRGEFSMNASMNINGTAPEETTALAVYGNGAVNGTNRQMKMALSIHAPESNLSDLTFEMIQVDDKRYVKESDLDGWLEAAPEDLEGILSFGMFPVELQKINAQFLKIYNTAPIEKIGSVYTEGVHTTKYMLSLDNQTLNDLIPEDLLRKDTDLQMVPDDTPLNFQIEFYLNDQNQIVKEIIKLNGKFEEEGKEFTLDMSIDVNFKNIGADIKITAPASVIDSIDSRPMQKIV